MTFTRATCKQQSTPAHFQDLPSKENTQNKQQMQELGRRCREKPNTANQELAPMSHMWTGELSAFEGRQQLAQAARNSQVPPWQGVSHPQNQVCSADSEKPCFCQSLLTWSLRGSCAEIKSWGYSESTLNTIQQHHTAGKTKIPVSVNRTALCKARTVIPVRQHCWDQSWNAASSWRLDFKMK